jgi:hypothetical protein
VSTIAKHPARRRGRWTYNSDSTMYGEAGWHLDGTPLVIDFMPGHGCDSKGEYQIYNDPCYWDHDPLDRYMDGAMRLAEQHWDSEHASDAEALKVLSGTAAKGDER